jgi:SAM-dependent methyltransferase
MSKKYSRLFEKAKGIKLDVGCGIHKQKGCLGMDIVKHPNVDIVHDVQKFPWPVPNDICTFVLMSHIWEHIEPKYRFQVMDECWRICRHDGQLLISCPFAGSDLAAAHPAHYMCPNEATFEFFDSDYFLWHSCSYKKPKPWKIIHNRSNRGGCIEIILEPRKDRNGKAHKPPDNPVKYGAVQLLERKKVDEVKWPKKKLKK